MEGYQSIFNEIISFHKTEHSYRDLAITCVSNYVIAMKKSDEPDEIDDLDVILVDLIKFFHRYLEDEKNKTLLNKLSFNSGHIYLRNHHYAPSVFYSKLGKNKLCQDLYKNHVSFMKRNFLKLAVSTA